MAPVAVLQRFPVEDLRCAPPFWRAEDDDGPAGFDLGLAGAGGALDGENRGVGPVEGEGEVDVEAGEGGRAGEVVFLGVGRVFHKTDLFDISE